MRILPNNQLFFCYTSNVQRTAHVLSTCCHGYDLIVAVVLAATDILLVLMIGSRRRYWSAHNNSSGGQ
jgi:hypothetical protein